MRTLVAINNTAPRQSIDAWTTQKSITRVIFSGKGRMCGPATDDPKVAGGRSQPVQGPR